VLESRTIPNKGAMNPIETVGLKALMERTRGRPSVVVGVIDGPIAVEHLDLADRQVRQISGKAPVACFNIRSAACVHGTFVLGMLAAKRDSIAPSICPDCTFLIRPIFSEVVSGAGPSSTPDELAAAILETVDGGAGILNLSVDLVETSSSAYSQLDDALSYAAKRGVLVVAAAGNRGMVGGSALTQHPWVLPVVASDNTGQPAARSDLGGSIGKRGLMAPGESITSLGADGRPLSLSGTSGATPFVTGALALLFSEFPRSSASQVKYAVMRSAGPRRGSIVPPMLNAWAAYQRLAQLPVATCQG
jgi:subtilisin family serine protease